MYVLLFYYDLFTPKSKAHNSKLFHHLNQTKKYKLKDLTNPRKNRTAPLENPNHHTVVTIPENLPLSNAEESVLSKGLNFVLISIKPTNSLPDKMSKNVFAEFNLKHFSITKKTNLTTQRKMPLKQ